MPSPCTSIVYSTHKCKFELHLIIWKRKDGMSKICECYVKKTRETVVCKIRQFSDRRNSASRIPRSSLKLPVEAI